MGAPLNLLTAKFLKRKSSLNRVFLPVFILFLISSCNKNISSIPGSSSCKVNEIKFKNYTAKAKIALIDKDNTTNFTANFRIKKDKTIWMSASVLGFEGMRCLITPDSVKVKQSYPEKKYYRFSFQELSDKYKVNVNYQLLQNLLVSNPPKKLSREDKFNEKECLLQQFLSPFTFNNYINSEYSKIEKIEVGGQNPSEKVTVNYSEFTSSGKYVYPKESKILAASADSTLLNMEISYKNTNFKAKNLKFPFKISSKYATQ